MKLQVGDLQAAPGSKTVGLQDLELAGTGVQLPIFLVNGAHAGPTLCVVG